MQARIMLSATAILCSASLLVGAAMSGCGSEATTGKRITLKTRIVADEGIDAPFTNGYGWSIKLSKVAVSVGSLYYFDGAPILSSGLSPRLSPDLLRGFFGVRVAHAHPGHYQEGNAMGQMLTPSSVDLASGPAELAAGEGTTGTFRSGRFVFGDPPAGPAAAALSGHVVVLEGEATKDSMVRVFRASAAVSDALDSYGDPNLEGCAFDQEPDIEADGTVTVHVKPSVWLDQAEFDDVAESTGDPVDLAPEQEAWKAFVRGLKKGSAVVFSYSKQ
jgi:hypothetical protein